MENIHYLKKNDCLYVMLTSKKAKEPCEVLTFPLGNYASIDEALEQCIVYDIASEEDFTTFNHLLPTHRGVKLSELGYFFTEKFYNEMVKVVMTQEAI
ncbi:hypothetical protein SAMN02799630_01891 [Paenibacillus sp. UNCCL117]|uniref:hypothetical protein n=1 Tax=unclassified Paenibacillus TaxID=185978 RepID=UPI00088313A1|nr:MULTISPECIES: hypothetical protein [unclassified Paenibacillus]SDD07997.1 hypothetical protein SAMN04488602_105238 [Paenibacillus sp. cl123]SFW31322.1 hypothetical protein SAMN02799630_01891 [Paenibacillus sp. UNCCL117]